MHKLLLIPSARKSLDTLSDKNFEQIKKKVLSLRNDPRPPGCLKLTDEEGYRIRSGDYRILYRIDDKRKIVYIYKIKHRRESYR